MKICSLDFESTHDNTFDTENMLITEVGAVLYDTEDKKPITLISDLLWDNSYPVSPQELVEITGITDELLQNHGISPAEGLSKLNRMLGECDYVLAHNGNQFDKPLYRANCERYDIPYIDKVWMDSMLDVEYPDYIATRKLTYLAAEHGFANPFSHRAVFDSLTTLKVLENYDFNKIAEMAHEPTKKVVAKVSKAYKDLAKKRGYRWDPDNKIWYKYMKHSFYLKEKENAPFEAVGVLN